MTQEALKLALEALVMYGERHRATYLLGGAWDEEITLGDKAITAIKEALAQPEQEPFCLHWEDRWGCNHYADPKEPHPVNAKPLYTTPPQRKPLSNQKIIEMYNEPRSDAEMIEFARAIEAAHGIWPENSDCYGPDWTDRDGEYLK